MKLVYIEWIDSHSGRGWRNVDDIKPTCAPLPCRSVGWVLQETKEAITLAPHVAGNDTIVEQACGDMTIPKKAVTRRLTIRLR